MIRFVFGTKYLSKKKNRHNLLNFISGDLAGTPEAASKHWQCGACASDGPAAESLTESQVCLLQSYGQDTDFQ